MSITHYCIGAYEIGCRGCIYEENWQTLNQLPERLSEVLQQTKAKRIDETECVLSGHDCYMQGANGSKPLNTGSYSDDTEAGAKP